MRSLAEHFSRLYGARPRIFRAPGRVNLIGEHTDYNQGLVMPAAIGFATRTALSPAADGHIHAQSLNLDKEFAFDPCEKNPAPAKNWSDYVRGVAIELRREGCRLQGANLLIRGDVPLGAGLSSSASLEVSCALALLADSGIEMDRTDIALLCQKAENNFVGAHSGIMDQFVACHGRKGNAILLDCRSLEMRAVPLPNGIILAIANTMARHELASGEYNTRRRQCEDAVRILNDCIGNVNSLRDASVEALERARQALDPVLYRRARHVITEIERVKRAAAALDRADLALFGKLMNESHVSLRDDYEVSSEELDLMVRIALEFPGVYGSRMTGGGFGGCTISIVETGRAEAFAAHVRSRYATETGIACEVYLCEAADGAGEETPIS